VETDQAFVEIFGRRPDWLAELEGRAVAARAGVARPKVFKAKVESDLMQFLMQRFRTKSPEDIRLMIKELVPVEETRAGRELIEKGVEKGKAQATLDFVHRLRQQGLSPEEISRLTSLPLE
jgi:uncharacterized protein (DUF3084 family)